MMTFTRRDTLRLGATGLLAASYGPALAQAGDWQDVLKAARGQTVYWNAWGGDERTNAFIAWVGTQTKEQFDVTISHVRLRDTSEAVTRVIAERQAGRDKGGSVDLIWINGPNFLTMKSQKLLLGPFAQKLPNWRHVDIAGKPSNVVDFTLPVDGYAAPWRLAKVVFVYDSARTPADRLPRSMPAMIAYAKANPGRVTHPNVRNFLGATFLKQALYELAPDAAVLARAPDDAGFASTTTPLWRWYDELRPLMWRRGAEFPETGPAQRQLLVDGEIDFYISFNPADAAVGIANGQLPESARVFVPERGSIGNTSFVAIPYNAAHSAGAMVVANFLLAPETQARAQDPRNMGNFSVLDLATLTPAQRDLFGRPENMPSLPTNAELGPLLPEPHPEWMTRLTAAWEQRYSR